MAEEWDVFALQPGGDYAQPEYLATLYSAFGKQIIVELDNTGSGQFSINRSSPECTEEVLAQGNLVKVRIPEISAEYIFAFFIETGDFTLISSQEEGGETLTFGGRGILSYLEYAAAAPHSYITGGQDPIAGVWRAYAAGTGSAPGQILRRMIEEMQHADRGLEFFVGGSQPLPLLTIDFDYTNDSMVDPWDTTDATDEFSYQVGEKGLAILLRLLETETIRVQMSPDFLLSAYNVDQFGRDLTGDAFGAGVVRFERGVNIATELRRELSSAASIPDTHIFVQGEADQYGGAALSDAASRVTRETFLAAFGTGTTALDAIGAVELAIQLERSDQVQFPINNRRTQDVVLVDPVSAGVVASTPGLATAGFYLPGPEGTNGDFWVGDTVRVHTGSGPFDYNEVDFLVRAITISRNDEDAELDIFVELVSPQPVPETIEPFLALYRSQTADGGGTVGWVCSGDDNSACGTGGGAPLRPTVGPLHTTPGTVPGCSATFLGFEIDGTGTVDIGWGDAGTFQHVIMVFGSLNGITYTVELLHNGSVIGTTSGTTVGSGPVALDPIIVTGVAVEPGDIFSARMTNSPPSQHYMDFGDLWVTSGSLVP